MAIHLVPLALGAAVGSLATYLYKDEKAREKIKSTVNDVADKVKSFVDFEDKNDAENKDKDEEANPNS